MTDAAVVICSRLKSSRLPGKVLREIAGVPALHHILKRVVPSGLPVVLAVPKEEFPEFARAIMDFPSVCLFTGQDDSPLHRMREALFTLPRLPKYVVRITHDDILVDAEAMMDLIEMVDHANAGYGVSEGILEGAGVEVIHTANLMWAAEHIQSPVEHISYFVKGNGLPRSKSIRAEVREGIRRPYRLTMDYPEDAAVLEAVLRHLGPMASNDDICRFLDRNGQLLRWNALPEVTVYTCARNAEKWIRAAMHSVMNCGYPNLEYVVVEDQSTDGTLHEIIGFAAYLKDSRFRLVVNEKNLGLASSSNIALAKARGRYVLRLDADDVLLPGAIDKMLSTLQREDLAAVYPNYHEVDEKGETLKANMAGNLYHHAGGALMDKKLLNEVRFRDGLRHWDSADLYNRLAGRFKVGYLAEPAFLYRRHGENMSLPSAERDAVARALEAGPLSGLG